MTRCTDCVEKAKLRNRDINNMLQKAKAQAIDEKEPKAICWEIKNGLYITGAVAAIQSGANIRYIVSRY